MGGEYRLIRKCGRRAVMKDLGQIVEQRQVEERRSDSKYSKNKLAKTGKRGESMATSKVCD